MYARANCSAELFWFAGMNFSNRSRTRLADFTSVVADGRFYSAAMLEGILERHQSHHDAYLYDALTVAVSRLMMRFLVKGADSPEASHGSNAESKLEER